MSPPPTGVLLEVTASCAGAEVLVEPSGMRMAVGPRGYRTITLSTPYGWAVVAGAVQLRAKALQSVNGKDSTADLAVSLVWPCSQ